MKTIKTANENVVIKKNNNTEVMSILNGTDMYIASTKVDNVVVNPATQLEATFTDMANINSHIFTNFIPTLTFSAGAVTLPSISLVYDKIKFVGDERVQSGLSWCHNRTVYSTVTGAGVGTTSLSSSGNDIVVTCSTTNPDFTGRVNGDIVLILDTSGNLTEKVIDSVSANTITLTTAAPTVNNYGGSITFCPNRVISANLDIASQQSVYLQGFWFKDIGIATDNAIYNSGYANINNCVMSNCICGYQGNMSQNSYIGPETSIVNTNMAILLDPGCRLIADGVSVLKQSSYGAIIQGCSEYVANFSYASWGNYGWYAHGGLVNVSDSYAHKMSSTGYHGTRGGVLHCARSSARYCTSYGFWTVLCYMYAENCTALSGNNGTLSNPQQHTLVIS